MELRFRSGTFLSGFLGTLGITLGILSGVLALAFIGGATRLSAQESENASQNIRSVNGENSQVTLVRTYNVRKIYRHRLGYRIDVMDYYGRVRTIYAKASWFGDPRQRDPESASFEVAATMSYMTSVSSVPSNYLTLRYENGRLVALSVYVDRPSYAKNTVWGVISAQDNIDGKFDIKAVIFSDPPAAVNASEIKMIETEKMTGQNLES